MSIFYIVATPIGNLSDLSERAKTILTEVDFVIAEDTRVSAILFRHIGINPKVIPYHDHSGHKQRQYIIEKIQTENSRVALISDAGTPLICDPGYKLLKDVKDAGITVSPVPGPCSISTALSCVGIASNCYSFWGFAPSPKIAFTNWFEQIYSKIGTHAFFQTSRNLALTLAVMKANEVALENYHATNESEYIPTELSLFNELTKKYEKIFFGTIDEAQAAVLSNPNWAKGELVIVININCSKSDFGNMKDLLLAFMRVCSISKASSAVAKLTGIAKHTVYEKAMELQGEK